MTQLWFRSPPFSDFSKRSLTSKDAQKPTKMSSLQICPSNTATQHLRAKCSMAHPSLECRTPAAGGPSPHSAARTGTSSRCASRSLLPASAVGLRDLRQVAQPHQHPAHSQPQLLAGSQGQTLQNPGLRMVLVVTARLAKIMYSTTDASQHPAGSLESVYRCMS